MVRRRRSIRRRQRPAVPAALERAFPGVLAALYAARGVTDPAELEPGLGGLHSPDALGGTERAADCLAEALEQGGRILVVGDFDADGATSTALAVLALRELGAAAVDYRIPDRFEMGYGLSPELAADIADPVPDLLLTVDNGVTSVEGVRVARERGMQVVITDHHLPGEALPEADALVNPNAPGDPFPSKHLAGVGVVFYLMLALRKRLEARGWFDGGRERPNMARFLDLVALGTVADIVPLDRNNRILVEQGLRRIRAGRARPGLLSLLAVAGRDTARLVAADLGFAAGPRLNAAGRLDDMAVGVECLLTEDPGEARTRARELDRLNRERREIEGEMQSQAFETLRALDERLAGADLPRGLCLFDREWHEGVVGLLASRIKERTHRPVVVLAPGSNGALKGSARSVPGFHIRDALEQIDARHPGLLSRFGGHAVAAGLSLDPDKLPDFREAFDALVTESLEEADLAGEIVTDGELEPAEINLATAEALRFAGPWGQGFPEPVFDGRFRVIDRRAVGNGKHMKLVVAPAGARQPLDAIAFHTTDEDVPPGAAHLHLVYRLDVNEFRGRRTPQLIVEYLEPA